MNRCLLLIPAALFLTGAWAGRTFWTVEHGADGEAVQKVETAESAQSAKPDNAGQGNMTRPANPALAKTWDFLQRLDKTTADGFPDFWEELQKGKTEKEANKDYSTEEELLVERWAEVDPAGALAWFSEAKEHLPMIRTLFRVWGRTDPDAAMAAIHGKVDFQVAALTGAISSAVEDPASLLAWGRRAPALGGDLLKQALTDILTPEVLLRACAHDPAAFRELATGLEESLQRRFEAVAIVHEAATDLPAALARIEVSTMKIGVSGQFFFDLSPLAESHPDKLLALAERFNAKFGKGWMKNPQDLSVRPVLEALARAAPDKIRALLETASGGDIGTQMIMGAAAANLFATDPRAALQLAPGGDAWVSDWVGGSPIRPGMAGTPDQTLELVRDAPPSAMRDAILRESLRTMMETSPEAAQTWVASLAAGELQGVADAMLRSGGSALESAVISANSGPPDSAVLDRVRAITRRTASGDFAGTAAQVAGFAPGEARNVALHETGSIWAEFSTSEALAWAESLPVIDWEHALSGVMKKWAENEPAAALEYIAGLPEGPEREEPVSAFATALRTIDPVTAMQWATTLEDPARRQETLTRIAESWLGAGPVAAKRERLESIPGLTPAEREQLMTVEPPP